MSASNYRKSGSKLHKIAEQSTTDKTVATKDTQEAHDVAALMDELSAALGESAAESTAARGRKRGRPVKARSSADKNSASGAAGGADVERTAAAKAAVAAAESAVAAALAEDDVTIAGDNGDVSACGVDADQSAAADGVAADAAAAAGAAAGAVAGGAAVDATVVAADAAGERLARTGRTGRKAAHGTREQDATASSAAADAAEEACLTEDSDKNSMAAAQSLNWQSSKIGLNAAFACTYDRPLVPQLSEMLSVDGSMRELDYGAGFTSSRVIAGITHINGTRLQVNEMIHELDLLQKEAPELAKRVNHEFFSGMAAPVNELLIQNCLERLNAKAVADLSEQQIRRLIAATTKTCTKELIASYRTAFKGLTSDRCDELHHVLFNEFNRQSMEEEALNPENPEQYGAMLAMTFKEPAFWLVHDNETLSEIMGGHVPEHMVEHFKNVVRSFYARYEEDLKGFVNEHPINDLRELDELAFYHYLLACRTNKYSDYQDYMDIVVVQNHLMMFKILAGHMADDADFAEVSELINQTQAHLRTGAADRTEADYNSEVERTLMCAHVRKQKLRRLREYRIQLLQFLAQKTTTRKNKAGQSQQKNARAGLNDRALNRLNEARAALKQRQQDKILSGLEDFDAEIEQLLEQEAEPGVVRAVELFRNTNAHPEEMNADDLARRIAYLEYRISKEQALLNQDSSFEQINKLSKSAEHLFSKQYEEARDLVKMTPDALHFCYLEDVLKDCLTLESERRVPLYLFLQSLNNIYTDQVRQEFSFNIEDGLCRFISPLLSYVLGLDAALTGECAVQEARDYLHDPDSVGVFLYQLFGSATKLKVHGYDDVIKFSGANPEEARMANALSDIIKTVKDQDADSDADATSAAGTIGAAAAAAAAAGAAGAAAAGAVGSDGSDGSDAEEADDSAEGNPANLPDFKRILDCFRDELPLAVAHNSVSPELFECCVYLYHQQKVYERIAMVLEVICHDSLEPFLDHAADNKHMMLESVSFFSKFLINEQTKRVFDREIARYLKTTDASDPLYHWQGFVPKFAGHIGSTRHFSSPYSVSLFAAAEEQPQERMDHGTPGTIGKDRSCEISGQAAERFEFLQAFYGDPASGKEQQRVLSNSFITELTADQGMVPVMPGTSGHTAYLIAYAFSRGELLGLKHFDFAYNTMRYADLSGSYQATADLALMFRPLFDPRLSDQGWDNFKCQLRAVAGYKLSQHGLDFPYYNVRLFPDHPCYFERQDVSVYFAALKQQDPVFAHIFERFNPALNTHGSAEGVPLMEVSAYAVILSNCIITYINLFEQNEARSTPYFTTFVHLLQLLRQIMRHEFSPDACLAVFRLLSCDDLVKLLPQEFKSQGWVHLFFSQFLGRGADMGEGLCIENTEINEPEAIVALFLQFGMLLPEYREQGYSLLCALLSGKFGNFSPVRWPYLDEYFNTAAALHEGAAISYQAEVSKALHHNVKSDLLSLLGADVGECRTFKDVVNYFVLHDLKSEHELFAHYLKALDQPTGYYELYRCYHQHEDAHVRAFAHTMLYYAAQMDFTPARSELEILKQAGTFSPLPFLVHLMYLEQLAESNVQAQLVLLRLVLNGILLPQNYLKVLELVDKNHNLFSNGQLKSLVHRSLDFNRLKEVLSGTLDQIRGDFPEEHLALMRNSLALNGNSAYFNDRKEAAFFNFDAALNLAITDPEVKTVLIRIADSLVQGQTGFERNLVFNWAVSMVLPDFLKELPGIRNLIENGFDYSFNNDTPILVCDFVAASLDNGFVDFSEEVALGTAGHHTELLARFNTVCEFLIVAMESGLIEANRSSLAASAMMALRKLYYPNFGIFRNLCRYLGNMGDFRARTFTQQNFAHLSHRPYGQAFVQLIEQPHWDALRKNAAYFSSQFYNGDALPQLISADHINAMSTTLRQMTGEPDAATAAASAAAEAAGGADAAHSVSISEADDSRADMLRSLSESQRRQSLTLGGKIARFLDERAGQGVFTAATMAALKQAAARFVRERGLFDTTGDAAVAAGVRLFAGDRELSVQERSALANGASAPTLMSLLDTSFSAELECYLDALVDFALFMSSMGWSLPQGLMFARNGWQLSRRHNGPTRSFAYTLARAALKGGDEQRRNFLYYCQSHYFKTFSHDDLEQDETSRMVHSFVHDVLQLDVNSEQFAVFAHEMAEEGFDEFAQLQEDVNNGYIQGRVRLSPNAQCFEQNRSVGYLNLYHKDDELCLTAKEAEEARQDLMRLTRELDELSSLQPDACHYVFQLSDLQRMELLRNQVEHLNELINTARNALKDIQEQEKKRRPKRSAAEIKKLEQALSQARACISDCERRLSGYVEAFIRNIGSLNQIEAVLTADDFKRLTGESCRRWINYSFCNEDGVLPTRDLLSMLPYCCTMLPFKLLDNLNVSRQIEVLSRSGFDTMVHEIEQTVARKGVDSASARILAQVRELCLLREQELWQVYYDPREVQWGHNKKTLQLLVDRPHSVYQEEFASLRRFDFCYGNAQYQIDRLNLTLSRSGLSQVQAEVISQAALPVALPDMSSYDSTEAAAAAAVAAAAAEAGVAPVPSAATSAAGGTDTDVAAGTGTEIGAASTQAEHDSARTAALEQELLRCVLEQRNYNGPLWGERYDTYGQLLAHTRFIAARANDQSFVEIMAATTPGDVSLNSATSVAAEDAPAIIADSADAVSVPAKETVSAASTAVPAGSAGTDVAPAPAPAEDDALSRTVQYRRQLTEGFNQVITQLYEKGRQEFRALISVLVQSGVETERGASQALASLKAMVSEAQNTKDKDDIRTPRAAATAAAAVAALVPKSTEHDVAGFHEAEHSSDIFSRLRDFLGERLRFGESEDSARNKDPAELIKSAAQGRNLVSGHTVDELTAGSSVFNLMMGSILNSFNLSDEHQYVRPDMFFEDDSPLSYLIYNHIMLNRYGQNNTKRLITEREFLDRLSFLGYYYGACDVIDMSFQDTINLSWQLRFNRQQMLKTIEDLGFAYINAMLEHMTAVENPELMFNAFALARMLPLPEANKDLLNQNDVIRKDAVAMLKDMGLDPEVGNDFLLETMSNYGSTITSYNFMGHAKALLNIAWSELRPGQWYYLYDDSLQHCCMFDLMATPDLLAAAPSFLKMLAEPDASIFTRAEIDEEIRRMGRCSDESITGLTFDQWYEGRKLRLNLLHNLVKLIPGAENQLKKQEYEQQISRLSHKNALNRQQIEQEQLRLCAVRRLVLKSLGIDCSQFEQAFDAISAEAQTDKGAKGLGSSHMIGINLNPHGKLVQSMLTEWQQLGLNLFYLNFRDPDMLRRHNYSTELDGRYDSMINQLQHNFIKKSTEKQLFKLSLPDFLQYGAFAELNASHEDFHRMLPVAARAYAATAATATAAATGSGGGSGLSRAGAGAEAGAGDIPAAAPERKELEAAGLSYQEHTPWWPAYVAFGNNAGFERQINQAELDFWRNWYDTNYQFLPVMYWGKEQEGCVFKYFTPAYNLDRICHDGSPDALKAAGQNNLNRKLMVDSRQKRMKRRYIWQCYELERMYLNAHDLPLSYRIDSLDECNERDFTACEPDHLFPAALCAERKFKEVSGYYDNSFLDSNWKNTHHCFGEAADPKSIRIYDPYDPSDTNATACYDFCFTRDGGRFKNLYQFRAEYEGLLRPGMSLGSTGKPQTDSIIDLVTPYIQKTEATKGADLAAHYRKLDRARIALNLVKEQQLKLKRQEQLLKRQISKAGADALQDSLNRVLDPDYESPYWAEAVAVCLTDPTSTLMRELLMQKRFVRHIRPLFLERGESLEELKLLLDDDVFDDETEVEGTAPALVPARSQAEITAAAPAWSSAKSKGKGKAKSVQVSATTDSGKPLPAVLHDPDDAEDEGEDRNEQLRNIIKMAEMWGLDVSELSDLVEVYDATQGHNTDDDDEEDYEEDAADYDDEEDDDEDYDDEDDEYIPFSVQEKRGVQRIPLEFFHVDDYLALKGIKRVSVAGVLPDVNDDKVIDSRAFMLSFWNYPYFDESIVTPEVIISFWELVACRPFPFERDYIMKTFISLHVRSMIMSGLTEKDIDEKLAHNEIDYSGELLMTDLILWLTDDVNRTLDPEIEVQLKEQVLKHPVVQAVKRAGKPLAITLCHQKKKGRR